MKKKIFLKKTSFQVICKDKIFKNSARKFFKNKWVSRYLTFGISRFRKIVLHNKVINQTLTIPHTILEKIISHIKIYAREDQTLKTLSSWSKHWL